MSTTVHVVMPFSRPDNFPQLSAMLEPLQVQWHLLCHDPESVAGNHPDWIHIHNVGHPPATFDPCYWKLNWFIENGPINDGDRYHYICDDDGITPRVSQAFSRALAPVAMCSMRRGFGFPYRAIRNSDQLTRGVRRQWGNPLIASRDALANHAWNGSVAVMGYVMRKMRFINYHGSDRFMGKWLSECFDAEFFPCCFAYHNWFEPGRYKRPTM